MNENAYRLCKILLHTILVVGVLTIGWRVSQTGRYVQFDLRKSYSPDGKTALSQPPAYIIDTWTGERIAIQ
jgi:hypothetical protein